MGLTRKPIIIVMMLALCSHTPTTIANQVTLTTKGAQKCETVPKKAYSKRELMTCTVSKRNDMWYAHDWFAPLSNGKCKPGLIYSPCTRESPTCKWVDMDHPGYIVGYETVCHSAGGHRKSTVTFADTLEMADGKYASIRVEGDCTNISVDSVQGKITQTNTKVCGNGEVRLHNRPGTDGEDEVIIKAELIQK